MPLPRDWIRPRIKDDFPSVLKMSEPTAHNIWRYSWDKLNCKLSDFLPVGNWRGKKSSVNALIYAKTKPLSTVREIFEGGIKKKIGLSFSREERYLGSISQLFHYHWAHLMNSSRWVIQKSQHYFLAKIPYTLYFYLYIFKKKKEKKVFLSLYGNYSSGI